MKNFKVGIVGYGWAAGAHIAAINATPMAQVTAIFSSRKLDPAELKLRYGQPITIYNELESMLQDSSLNVISLCSYPSEHARQITAAARAGKHLIIEKPLCLNASDLAIIQQAVRNAGIKTCICFELRYSDQFQKIRSIIDRGLLGKIHYGEVDYFHGIG